MSIDICPDVLLTDDQMQHMVTDGALLLHLAAPPSMHAALAEELATLWQIHGDPGHALVPQLTHAQAVLTDPVLQGALRSILGNDYVVDPCRHVHLNIHPMPGGWHQDDYCAIPMPPMLYPALLMVCYFPEDTPPTMGPTGVWLGSHAAQVPPDGDAGELLGSGPAGTCILLRGDLWHRATANTTGRPRWMLKFLFTRQSPPTEPTWQCLDRTWRCPQDLAPTILHQDEVWASVWAWLCGTVLDTKDV